MFERYESWTASAAILCPAVCTSDQTNKAEICGRNIKYIVSQYLSVLSLLKSETTWLHHDELQSRKVLLLYTY